MQQNRNDIDESIRFVAQHYRQGVFDTAKGWKRLTHSLQEFRRVQYLSLVTRVAAVALLLIVTGIGIWISVNRPSQLLAESDNTIFSLPDHTEVVMQEGAELTYDRHFGNRYRHVSMHGNIRFSVTHDETMPFIVFTPTAKITVLGTVFNVSENDEGTELSVISGKVLFTPESPAAQILCTKGMRVHYREKGKEINVFSDDTSIFYSAERNELSINNATLEQLLMLLSQYYNVQMKAPEEELPLRLTSTFSGKSIIEILNIINITLDSHIQIVN